MSILCMLMVYFHIFALFLKECQGADDLLMDQAQNDELCSYESQPVDVASRLENESTPQINVNNIA